MFEFHVPDMSCGHCVGRIEQALRQADPACKIDVDLPQRVVRVTSSADRAALAQALEQAGYPPALPTT
jgi:copper chaperone